MGEDSHSLQSTVGFHHQGAAALSLRINQDTVFRSTGAVEMWDDLKVSTKVYLVAIKLHLIHIINGKRTANVILE